MERPAEEVDVNGKRHCGAITRSLARAGPEAKGIGQIPSFDVRGRGVFDRGMLYPRLALALLTLARLLG